MKQYEFDAVIVEDPDSGGAYVAFPWDIREEFGKGRVKVNALVNEFPEVYKCIGETDIDKTYSMPKQYVSYRKPRRITVPDKERRKAMMDEINKHKMQHFVMQNLVDFL